MLLRFQFNAPSFVPVIADVQEQLLQQEFGKWLAFRPRMVFGGGDKAVLTFDRMENLSTSIVLFNVKMATHNSKMELNTTVISKGKE